MLDYIMLAQDSFEFDYSFQASPIVILIYIVLVVIGIAALWRLFTKADKPGWAAIIPIYNTIVLLEIVGRPIWWIILFFIPLVNIIVSIMLAFDLVKSFGKDTALGCGLLIPIVNFVVILMLAFGDAEYVGPAALQ